MNVGTLAARGRGQGRDRGQRRLHHRRADLARHGLRLPRRRRRGLLLLHDSRQHRRLPRPLRPDDLSQRRLRGGRRERRSRDEPVRHGRDRPSCSTTTTRTSTTSAIDYVLVDPGTYFVNVLEHSGAGDAAYFLKFERISLAGIFEETEPNDTPATANAIAYGRKATGEIDAADTDFYSFSGTAGDMVRLQMFDEFNVQVVVEDADFDLIAPDGVTELDTGGDDDLATEDHHPAGDRHLLRAGDRARRARDRRLRLRA